MAKGTRGQASKVIVWIILILLIVGLGGFGVRNFGGNVQTVGEVGGAPIEVNRYARALDQELRAFSAQTGQNITMAQAQAVGLDRFVLQRLIGAAALENEIAEIGLSVGDAEVQRQVVSNQAFLGIDGKFDREAYEFTLQRQGLTPKSYEAGLRRDAARGILEAAVSAGVVPGDTYGRVIRQYLGERRSFSWIELDETALTDPLPEPSAEDLRAFYEANIDTFTLPESKTLTYVWLSPEMVVDRLDVSEEDLRALYEQRADEYQTPERRLVERLVFASEDEAASAANDIAAGRTSFEDIVAGRGLELADLDLGDVTRDDLGDAAAGAVFAAEGPGVVGPVETDLGPALFRVNAILPARTTAFEDARAELLDELHADRARRLIADQIADLDDQLAAGSTLEDLAADSDMELGTLDWSEGSDEGIAAYAAFAEAARAATEGDFPEIHELDDGGVFALRVDRVNPARPETIEELGDRLAAAWRDDQQQRRLRDLGAELVQQIGSGTRIGALGYPVTVETRLTRDAFIEGTSPALVQSVFELEVGGATSVQGDGRLWVAQLDAIVPAAEDDPDTARISELATAQARDGIAQDILAAFTRDAEQRAGISLNQAALNAVHAQFP